MKTKRTLPSPASPGPLKPRRARPAPELPERERLLWLLEFLRRDLTALRPGERIDLTDDCYRLLQLRDREAVGIGPPDGYAFALAKKKGASNLRWPDAVVLEVQTTLKAGLAELEAGRGWRPFEKSMTMYLRLHDDHTMARHYEGTYATVMLASAIDLLAQWWPELRRCAYKACNVLFLPEEGRQIYHDKKCSSLARWHRLPKRDYKEELVRRELRTGPGRGKGRKKR